MKAKTLLVDASYLLKRSFHGVKNGHTNAGHIGGVYGFLTKIRKFIKDLKVNKVVLVWDGENGGIQRHRLYHPYKSNRKDKTWYQPIELTDEEIKRELEKDQSILAQRKRVQAYSEELFLRQLEVNEIEADDLIAEYCKRYHKEEEIILYTNDKDFLQLLELDIYIYLESVGELIEAGNFFNYFKFFYKNALTMKIICGDTSDVIPGVSGLQETTLLKYFPELIDTPVKVRDLCRKAVQINEDRQKEKKKPIQALKNLTEQSTVEQLKVNYQLMNLSDPFLNDEAYQALNGLELPLSDVDRGTKNLYPMMVQDDFLSLYSNFGNFADYVTPFYTVVAREKDLLKKYKQNNLTT
jgi:5'-3' exonuclease